MKPSFFSLFKRGRYLSSPDDGDDSDAAKKLREERERFAVAVLAFCLRYDEDFRRHFWEKVCRVPDDPEQMPLITADGIAIEPPEWADLSLISEDGKSRYMWVVEAKAGASLKPKQNPSIPEEFEKPGRGYGALFADAETKRGTKMRYIVLGANDPLEIGNGQKRLGISVQERRWGCLLDGMGREGIFKDLIDTFGELQIGEFYMEKVRALKVSGGIQDAVKASTILVAFCGHLGIRKSRLEFNCIYLEDGKGCFGYYVKQPLDKVSQTYRKLQEATRASGSCIAWFGYESDAAGNECRAVWFYFNSEKKRDALTDKLKKRFPSAENRPDGKDYCAYVSSTLNETTKDIDWFQSVVDFALES